MSAGRNRDREGVDADGFLGRWSRLKRVRAAEPPEVAPPGDALPAREAAEQSAEAAPPRTDAEILDDLGLPDPDSLGRGDDFGAFMARAVPEHLRRRALRRLWLSDPLLANVDGLVDYGEDFTDAARVVENLQTAYRVGRGMVRDEPGPGAADGAPGDAGVADGAGDTGGPADGAGPGDERVAEAGAAGGEDGHTGEDPGDSRSRTGEDPRDSGSRTGEDPRDSGSRTGKAPGDGVSGAVGASGAEARVAEPGQGAPAGDGAAGGTGDAARPPAPERHAGRPMPAVRPRIRFTTSESGSNPS